MNIFLLLYCNVPFLLLENLINFFTGIVQSYSDSLNRFFFYIYCWQFFFVYFNDSQSISCQTLRNQKHMRRSKKFYVRIIFHGFFCVLVGVEIQLLANNFSDWMILMSWIAILIDQILAHDLCINLKFTAFSTTSSHKAVTR